MAGAQGQMGPQGAPGAPGTPGLKGADGPDGPQVWGTIRARTHRHSMHPRTRAFAFRALVSSVSTFLLPARATHGVTLVTEASSSSVSAHAR
jgi:hypothetical protein